MEDDMYHNPKTRIQLSVGHSLPIFVAEVPEDAPFDDQHIEIHKADLERIMSVISAYRGVQRELQLIVGQAQAKALFTAMAASTAVPDPENQDLECGCSIIHGTTFPCDEHAAGGES